MKVTIIDVDQETHTLAYSHLEYPNLMELIHSAYYSEMGECRGKGLCGTCMVQVISGNMGIPINEQEKQTLKVNGVIGEKYRLACQMMLNEDIDGNIFKEIEGI